MPERYIGVTGFSDPSEVSVASHLGALMPGGLQFMCGVLVSQKSLRGELPSRPRYPTLQNARVLYARLLHAGPQAVWPVVHYNTRAEGAPLRAELEKLAREFVGLRALQLNVESAPDKSVLDSFCEAWPAVDLIFQANPRALPALGSPLASVLGFGASVAPWADYVLLDFSRGNGLPLDVGLARAVYGAWAFPTIGLAVAGGLDADRVRQLAGLPVSCDAESALRTPDDALDYVRTVDYVHAALDTLARERDGVRGCR